MRVVVAGSSGLVGSALVVALKERGYEVTRLLRKVPSGSDAYWDPSIGSIEAAAFEGASAVVNLAGAGIGDKRWSAKRKAMLRSSRIDSTALLAKTLPMVTNHPPVLVNASAIGWYGPNRGDEELTERSTTGPGFLAKLCRDWEAATAPCEKAGIRVVHLRTGIVLSRRGGALARQLPLLRAGLGGRLGSGRQWVSWISLVDEVGAIIHCIENEAIAGPVNATAPAPVTNAALTAALARALHRPAIAVVPRPAIWLVLGREMAEETVFASQRVLPQKLLETGYRFEAPNLDAGVRSALAR